MSIEVHNLSFSYDEHVVLDKINFSAKEGELIAFLGPNGAGKTTFFRCMLGFLKPSEGEILVNGKKIDDYSRKELASQIAYIPQSYSPAFNHTVIDSVLMGMTSQLGMFETPSEKHREKAFEVLKSLKIDHLAEKGSLKISGGERQLMLLARAMVQDAKLLIMDEPTANLDFGNSYRVMERIARLKEQGYTVIFSTHDPNQALNFASRIVALHGSRIIADGEPSTCTPEIMKTLYGVDVSMCGCCNRVIIKP